MSKLNYSKWDNLELSDDSDIEVHPNVDKRSFIRWKQRDIHDKRAERKDQLDQLRAEASTNATLVPMLDALLKGVRDEGSSFYSREVSRLSAGRAGRGNKDGPDGPTSEDMVLSLLLQINEQPSVKGKSAPSVELDEALAQALEEHVSKLKARQAEVQKSISEMEAEEKRKITSDSIREGWSSGVSFLLF